MSDTFNNSIPIIKSYIPTANVPIMVEILIHKLISEKLFDNSKSDIRSMVDLLVQIMLHHKNGN